MTTHLRRAAPAELRAEPREPFDAETLATARRLVAEVREGGEAALRAQAEGFGDIEPGAPLIYSPDDCDAALRRLPPTVRAVLERTARRIESFARAQRAAFAPLETTVVGGAAGHRLLPVRTAGCYAPGGRHPLPSSLLMGAIPARVAGVDQVWVASPRVCDVTLAAAALADADGLLAVGGAGAIAALASGLKTGAGAVVPRCDLVVGPGNRFVTAAKYVVSATTGIDALAGPSELVVVADKSADPRLVAADLLAQAEHDVDAEVVLVTNSEELVAEVDLALDRLLSDLPTAETARAAVERHGIAVVVPTMEDAIAVCDTLAPEHLALHGTEAEHLGPDFRSFGALFLGSSSAEVLGDYGAGPNHILPTGGTARFASGLSVLSFLRLTSWLRMHPGRGLDEVARDAAALARLEGLEAHARSAEARDGGEDNEPQPQLQPETQRERLRIGTTTQER